MLVNVGLLYKFYSIGFLVKSRVIYSKKKSYKLKLICSIVKL